MNNYIWSRYKLYCWNRGLADGNFKNFKNFIEEQDIIDTSKAIKNRMNKGGK